MFITSKYILNSTYVGKVLTEVKIQIKVQTRVKPFAESKAHAKT